MNPELSPLWISLKVAGSATLASLILGVAIAYRLLNYRGRWRSLFDSLAIAPLVLPPTVVGLILLQILGRRGWLGPLLERLNIEVIFTWQAGAIAATVVALPLVYRTALGAFEQIDANLLATARVLGASEWRVFARVALPLALPGIIAGGVLAFARALGEFGATLMVAGNIPGVTTTLPLAIYSAVEAGSMTAAWRWSALALSLSLSAIALVQLGVNNRHVLRRRPAAPHPPHPGIWMPPISATAGDRGLYVEIERARSGFRLSIAFACANRAPLGVLGASGSGKTTLLHCLAGTETPSAGRMVLNGRVLFDAARGICLPSRDRKVGIVFQNYAVFPHLTVGQNIAFGLPRHLSKTQVQQVVEHYLELIRLPGFCDRRPSELSGGQLQRLAIARAIASQPELLLLDEPFSALDSHLRQEMERELTTLLRDFPGATLLVTHDRDEAYRLCPHLLVLEQGRALACGPKQSVFEQPRHLSVARLTGCKNFSRAERYSARQVKASDWGCLLTASRPVPKDLAYVGARAYQIGATLCDRPFPAETPNAFPCWLVSTQASPHRLALYLKLNAPPECESDYHLHAEVFKESWAQLKNSPQPLYVQLPPRQVLLLAA